MKFFDTHAHIGLINDDKIQQLLSVSYAKHAGVEHIMSITNTLASFETVYKNLNSAKNVYHAVGISPTEANNLPVNWELKVQELAQLDRVKAIGETGLDYVKNAAPKPVQIEIFKKHLALARKLDLPVIIHNREAGADILSILKSQIPPKGAIFHCYSLDSNFAFDALQLNTYFSFSGNITYKNVKPILDTIHMLPMERILIESETPFIVPAKYTNKKRNSPEYIVENAKVIARIKQLDLEECCDILYNNSLRAFNINE